MNILVGWVCVPPVVFGVDVAIIIKRRVTVKKKVISLEMGKGERRILRSIWFIANILVGWTVEPYVCFDVVVAII